ncbi:MAG: tetratricopeptide repeat protein [Candidatus Hydrogenedentes bacterium]|nr:tetratricopeptide repeat protein [Candidatus Hydrogenedentota bacterium]
MRPTIALALLGALGAALLTGCETTGGNQTQTTIYDMHRRIVKLDKDLGDSVTRLNETSASLNQRVEEMDMQTRELRSLLEENQNKLNAISQDLARFYRALNLSPPSSTATPVSGTNVSVGPTMIERPAQTPVPAGQNTLQDSAPIPTDRAVLGASPQPADEPVPASPAPAGQAGDPRTMYEQALKIYQNGDNANAVKKFDEYLGQYPNNEHSANALFWKAKAQLNMGSHADAVQSFEQMRSRFPNDTKVPFAMHNQAVAHSRLGQTAEADRLMQAVIDQYPMSPVAEQARSDLQKLRGQ